MSGGGPIWFRRLRWRSSPHALASASDSGIASASHGELYMGGVGLSPGDWRDDESSRAAFLPHRFSEGPERSYLPHGGLGPPRT
jgi:hypothetical protein